MKSLQHSFLSDPKGFVIAHSCVNSKGMAFQRLYRPALRTVGSTLTCTVRIVSEELSTIAHYFVNLPAGLHFI